ncbi:MAG: T9SS type A sorting domain-containing protein [Phycisphaerae bacterium]|nr:T9SS type A sorting domain-containing protein [Saprospiraceae bacterium]
MIKPYIRLLLAALSVSTSASAQLPDSCAASTLVRQHYLGSAKIIALRQMLGDPAWADSVYIPAVIYNPVLQGLSAVFNATQFPERDTVTECLDIQAANTPVSPVGISLVVNDTSTTWAKNLHQGIFPTGNTTVDDLFLRYHLKKTSSYQFSKFFFFLENEEPLNTVALAKLFNNIPDTHADANSSIGGGNDIRLDTVGGSVTLRYSTGWGDCPAGCIFKRNWIFLVQPNCSVQFLGAQGDQLTSEVSCNSTYECYTTPLCMPWLQDSLQHYAAQFPDCTPTQPPLSVTLYQNFSSIPVLGIHGIIGIDAEFTDFFYCDGTYIGSCSITIAGPFCTPTYLFDFQHGDIIWDCTQPLPTPANCTSAAPVPISEALSFQLSPNPSASGQVVLRASFGTPAKGRLSVVDLYGKCILEKTFEAEQLVDPLNLEGQSPGVYLVRLEAANRISTRKLVLLSP